MTESDNAFHAVPAPSALRSAFAWYEPKASEGKRVSAAQWRHETLTDPDGRVQDIDYVPDGFVMQEWIPCLQTVSADAEPVFLAHSDRLDLTIWRTDWVVMAGPDTAARMTDAEFRGAYVIGDP